VKFSSIQKAVTTPQRYFVVYVQVYLFIYLLILLQNPYTGVCPMDIETVKE